VHFDAFFQAMDAFWTHVWSILSTFDTKHTQTFIRQKTAVAEKADNLICLV